MVSRWPFGSSFPSYLLRSDRTNNKALQLNVDLPLLRSMQEAHMKNQKGETFFHENSGWTSEIIPISTPPKLGSPKRSKPNDTNRKRVPFLHVSRSCHRCWKGQLSQELVSQKNKGIISSQGALFLDITKKKHEKNHPTRIHPKIMKVYLKNLSVQTVSRNST